MSKITAKWGSKSWLVNEKKIMNINNLSTSYKMKEDKNESLDGKQSQNFKGRELVPLNISTRLVKYGEIDVRSQINAWQGLIGQSHPLEIGEEPLGIGKSYRLKEVNVSNVDLSNTGIFLSANIDLVFDEDPDYKPPVTEPPALTQAQVSTFKVGGKVQIMSNADIFGDGIKIADKYKRSQNFEIIGLDSENQKIRIKLDDGESKWISMKKVTLVS